MRISDWSSDVCSSDLHVAALPDQPGEGFPAGHFVRVQARDILDQRGLDGVGVVARGKDGTGHRVDVLPFGATFVGNDAGGGRSEEHTSELQSLMRISYAVFCLKKKTTAQHVRSHLH